MREGRSDFRSDNGSGTKGTIAGGDRGGVCDEDVEFEVRLSCVAEFCAGKGGASGSAVLPGGSGETSG